MIRLTFVMFTDLRVNRGTENVLFNLLKYKPDNIFITIIETNYTEGNPLLLSEEEMIKKIGNSNIIKIPSLITNDKINQNGIKNHKIIRFFKMLIFDLILYIRIKIIVRKNILKNIRNTDVVYLFFNRYSLLFNNKIPVIGSEHTSELLSYPKIWKTYFLYKNINGFHAFPKHKELLKKYNFKYNMVLPNGVDTELFYPDYNNSNSKLKVLFNAALIPEKGLDILIPVINSITNENIEFHIAGGGPLANEIKSNKKIIFHEKPDNLTLGRIYRECDLFVYPTHADSYSLVVLQALSSGLYVICSDYLKGIFDDFENKYLEYLPLNKEIFKKRIIEIANNRNLIKHDKKEEYNYVKDNYDWSVISKKFYEYMKKFYKENTKE